MAAKKKTAKKKAKKKAAAKKSRSTKSAARKKSSAKKSSTKKKPASKARAATKKPATKKPATKKPASKKKPAGRSARASATRRGQAARPRKRHPLSISTQHVDFLSYKVDQLRKFYGEILELPTETTDVDGLSYVVVKTSDSSTLGFMPPHPEMRGERPIPREPTLYFVVRSVDDAYRQLSEKGVAFMGPPEEMPWGFRVLTTTDPEGRTIMLASKIAAKR